MTGETSNNLVKIELTDEEAKEFIAFRKHKDTWLAEDEAWKQVKQFAKNVKHGSFTLSIRDGRPFKIDNALQNLLIII